MISLLKYLDGKWEEVRGYLRDDLDHLESAINQRWNATFGDTNTLKSSTIAGDATKVSRSVTNTGPDQTLYWAQVDLATGVTNRLPFAHIVAATQPVRLVGTGVAGDFRELSLGSGLSISGAVLSTSVPPGLDGDDGQDAIPTIPGAVGPQGLPGLLGMPGNDGDDGLDAIPTIPGAVGPQGLPGLLGMPGNDGDDGLDAIPGPQGNPGAAGADNYALIAARLAARI